jgi:hypothetical protein
MLQGVTSLCSLQIGEKLPLRLAVQVVLLTRGKNLLANEPDTIGKGRSIPPKLLDPEPRKQGDRRVACHVAFTAKEGICSFHSCLSSM